MGIIKLHSSILKAATLFRGISQLQTVKKANAPNAMLYAKIVTSPNIIHLPAFIMQSVMFLDIPFVARHIPIL